MNSSEMAQVSKRSPLEYVSPGAVNTRLQKNKRKKESAATKHARWSNTVTNIEKTTKKRRISPAKEDSSDAKPVEEPVEEPVEVGDDLLCQEEFPDELAATFSIPESGSLQASRALQQAAAARSKAWALQAKVEQDQILIQNLKASLQTADRFAEQLQEARREKALLASELQNYKSFATEVALLANISKIDRVDPLTIPPVQRLDHLFGDPQTTFRSQIATLRSQLSESKDHAQKLKRTLDSMYERFNQDLEDMTRNNTMVNSNSQEQFLKHCHQLQERQEFLEESLGKNLKKSLEQAMEIRTLKEQLQQKNKTT